jgi:hypothetical protein
LTGIRILEKNPAVLGQVVMWAALLKDPEIQDMFRDSPYPYLGFGDLLTFESALGIEDGEWLSSDDDPEAVKAREQAEQEELDFLDVLHATDAETDA